MIYGRQTIFEGLEKPLYGLTFSRFGKNRPIKRKLKKVEKKFKKGLAFS